jgi:hypothetical protein
MLNVDEVRLATREIRGGLFSSPFPSQYTHKGRDVTRKKSTAIKRSSKRGSGKLCDTGTWTASLLLQTVWSLWLLAETRLSSCNLDIPQALICLFFAWIVFVFRLDAFHADAIVGLVAAKEERWDYYLEACRVWRTGCGIRCEGEGCRSRRDLRLGSPLSYWQWKVEEN